MTGRYLFVVIFICHSHLISLFISLLSSFMFVRERGSEINDW